MADSEPQIGYLLKNAQAALHISMDVGLRPLGITVSQYVCLHLLHAQPGISASELARSAFVTRQSMNTLLQALLERELVERRTATGRALPAQLTVAGEQVLLRAEVLVDEIEARMLAGLSEVERSDLAHTLSGFITSLEAGRH